MSIYTRNSARVVGFPDLITLDIRDNSGTPARVPWNIWSTAGGLRYRFDLRILSGNPGGLRIWQQNTSTKFNKTD